MCISGALTTAMAVSGAALAQGVALNRFDPAPAGDRMFGVESPFAAGEATPHVALLVDYAHNPYTLRHGPGIDNKGSVVSDQFFMHLNASMSLLNRINLNFAVPAAMLQAGSDPTDGRQVYTSPRDGAFGDVRFGARVNLFGDYNAPFQLAVSGYLWLPSGAKDLWVSDGKVRGQPNIVLGGRTSRIVWSFAGGVQFRPTQVIDTIQQGPQLHLGGGIGFLFANGDVQIGPEVKAAIGLKKANAQVSGDNAFLKSTNAEVTLGGRYRIFDNFEVGVGVGSGLTSGLGTPDVRMIGMVAFTPKMKGPIQDRDGDQVPDDEDACPDTIAPREANPKKPGCPAAADRDGDGIADDVDACPDKAGVASPDAIQNGCPADRDGDGVADAVDACPDQAGPANEDPAKSGCPRAVDADGDGIADAQDACPDIPGMKSSDPKENGCPGDTDGDGIRDDKDACLNVKGIRSRNPKRNGCPRAAITDTGITINEQVEFDTGTAKIKATSDQLIADVAGILVDHPEIAKVEVQGHTDNVGSKVGNKQLSTARADAVRRALIKKGVQSKRLVARGYGDQKPIASNDTEQGRADNRRVQFVILEKKGADHKGDKHAPKHVGGKKPLGKKPVGKKAPTPGKKK